MLARNDTFLYKSPTFLIDVNDNGIHSDESWKCDFEIGIHHHRSDAAGPCTSGNQRVNIFPGINKHPSPVIKSTLGHTESSNRTFPAIFVIVGKNMEPKLCRI